MSQAALMAANDLLRELGQWLDSSPSVGELLPGGFVAKLRAQLVGAREPLWTPTALPTTPNQLGHVGHPGYTSLPTPGGVPQPKLEPGAYREPNELGPRPILRSMRQQRAAKGLT